MTACTVVGPGVVRVHGRVLEGDAPTFSGPLLIEVTKTGAVIATVEQPETKTAFAIEPGARLRMTITRPHGQGR